jgi:hypothetical protein
MTNVVTNAVSFFLTLGFGGLFFIAIDKLQLQLDLAAHRGCYTGREVRERVAEIVRFPD